jgi:GT2 family glycosyltransferase
MDKTPKISFCISTNGEKSYITKTSIASILNIANNIDYEVFVGGKIENLKDFNNDRVIYNEYLLEANTGRLAKLRNLTASKATGDILVFLDDDIIFDENWLNGLLDFNHKNDWSILGNIIIGPGGDRYWDRSIKYQTPDGQHLQHLVDYDHPVNDTRLYQTGCFWILKKGIYDIEKWDNRIGYYAANNGGVNEDVEYSTRLQSLGYHLHFNKYSIVWHWDDSYRQFSWPTGEQSCGKINNYIPIKYKKEFIDLVSSLKYKFDIR